METLWCSQAHIAISIITKGHDLIMHGWIWPVQLCMDGSGLFNYAWMDLACSIMHGWIWPVQLCMDGSGLFK